MRRTSHVRHGIRRWDGVDLVKVVPSTVDLYPVLFSDIILLVGDPSSISKNGCGLKPIKVVQKCLFRTDPAVHTAFSREPS